MKKFVAVVLALIQFVTMGNGNIQIKATEPQEVIFENYTYRVVNEEKREIELLAVDTEEERFEVPETINGYTVVALGKKDGFIDDLGLEALRIKGSISANVKELVIPNSVRIIGESAFLEFKNLEKVIFPTDLSERFLWIRKMAFSGCESLKEADIPARVMVSEAAFSSCISLKKVILRDANIYRCFSEDIEVLHLKSTKETGKINLAEALGDLKIYKLISHTNVKEVNFTANALDGSPRVSIDNVIVNDKKTKLRYITDKKKWATATKIQTLYTIKGAKCIAVAEREGINHHVKSVSKMGKVTKKKAKNGYRYSWKKVKTSVEKNVYKEKYAKWKISNYNAKTVYRVYGKTKKADDYKLLGKTTKTTYKTTFKYVKIKPVKGWS